MHSISRSMPMSGNKETNESSCFVVKYYYISHAVFKYQSFSIKVSQKFYVSPIILQLVFSDSFTDAHISPYILFFSYGYISSTAMYFLIEYNTLQKQFQNPIEKSISLTHKYVTAHVAARYKHFNYMWRSKTSFLDSYINFLRHTNT